MSKLAKEVRETKAYYEKYAEKWAATHADSFHDEKEFRVLMHYLTPKASVIDIGCASGTLVPLFLGIGKGLKYYGIDIAKKFINIASRRYPQLSFIEGKLLTSPHCQRKNLMHFSHAQLSCIFPFQSGIRCLQILHTSRNLMHTVTLSSRHNGHQQ